MSNRVEVYNAIENGTLKVGVRVNGPATLQDLIDVWQPLCDDLNLFKKYAAGNHALCVGCQLNCCSTAYVIPDLISFKRIAASFNLEWEAFIAGYFQQEKLNIGLLRLKANPCIFLKDNRCSVYPMRSLICRFYLCCHLVGETEQLLYKIAWSGAAATQIFAEQKGLIMGEPKGSTSFDRLFINLLEEYRGEEGVGSFLQAQDYKDISLQQFLPVEGSNILF